MYSKISRLACALVSKTPFSGNDSLFNKLQNEFHRRVVVTVCFATHTTDAARDAPRDFDVPDSCIGRPDRNGRLIQALVGVC